MKRLLLTTLACALMCVRVGAQAASNGQASVQGQAATQTSGASSAELLEAEKLNIQAVKLFNAGKYDAAITLAKRVLQIREKVLTPGDEQINAAIINLAELYLSKQKYGDAEDYYQRLLSIYERVSAPNPSAMAKVLDRLAVLNYMQFHFDQAEKLYQRTLALREQAQGPEHLEVAASYFNLAEFYRLRGNYEKAEPYYQQLLEIREKLPQDARRAYIDVKARYSCALRKEGKTVEAKNIAASDSDIRHSDELKESVPEVVDGKAISLPAPAYPSEAKGERASGTVKVQVIIDETGKVMFACAVTGHKLLLLSSEQAAMQARFSPTLVGGAPVKVAGVITYNYVAPRLPNR
jgi:tetratricopeptide (TPR) repeat protein